MRRLVDSPVGRSLGVSLIALSVGAMLTLLIVRPTVRLYFAGRLPQILSDRLPETSGWDERAFVGEALVQLSPVVVGASLVLLLMGLALLSRYNRAQAREASDLGLSGGVADGSTDRRGVLRLGGVAVAGVLVGVPSGFLLRHLNSRQSGLFARMDPSRRADLTSWARSAAADLEIESLSSGRRQVIREGAYEDAILAANVVISEGAARAAVVRYQGWILPRASIKIAMEAT